MSGMELNSFRFRPTSFFFAFFCNAFPNTDRFGVTRPAGSMNRIDTKDQAHTPSNLSWVIFSWKALTMHLRPKTPFLQNI